jgi:hypothetical protein
VAVVLALCLASSAVCVASQTLLLRLPLPFGSVMSVCGVFETRPVWRVGVWWMSPLLSSALPPFGGVSNGCLIVPWLPVLPQRGEVIVP